MHLPATISLLRPELVGVAAVGLAAGVLIGCIGVGGVIIVPALAAAGYPITTAIAVAMAGYILTGLVGTWVFARRGTVDRRLVWPICAGSMPAAVLGALAAQTWSPLLLESIIASMTALSGLHALLRRPADRLAAKAQAHRTATWGGIGAIAGFISSLTGTGGPAALIPLLLWMDVPTLTTVGLAQMIQLPIATLATISNVWAGKTDLLLGAYLGIGLTLGARLGVEVAYSLNPRVLRRLVAIMLLGAGVFLFGRVLLSSRAS